MHDVTHFKQLARLKDDFVATVSHDLRAPLTSIVGYAQMIQDGGISEQKQQEALRRIESSAWHMSNLITNLLDMATLEAGIDLNTESVDIGSLALAAAEVLEGAALAKGLTIQYEIQKHPPIRVDRQLITQVWRNLIDNAIKYTEQGSITIRVEAAEDQVLGQIIDTGPGISPANMPYVFDKFFRARQPDTPEITGTGLGLSLVKIIVERHGGRIWVESEAGNGATFAFTLPLSR
jgi:signal transduction histidine kinase